MGTFNTRLFKGTLTVCLLLAIPLSQSAAQDTLDLFPQKKGSLICWSETRTAPRPLRIHYLRLDLNCPDLELITLPGDDPDGAGPAESTLTLPEELFTSFNALAAINANAFAGLPGTENDIRGWYKGRPVDIHGTVVSNGIVVSPVEKDRATFWINPKQNPSIGSPKPGEKVWQAVADWQAVLVLNNEIVPSPTTTTLHPRSAAGFDSSGKWLLMVVVDGRQSGYSEGVSLYELARILQKQNYSHAINLDGGGSSIMLVKNPDGSIRTINSPSGRSPRPVPVMLGVRKSGKR